MAITIHSDSPSEFEKLIGPSGPSVLIPISDRVAIFVVVATEREKKEMAMEYDQLTLEGRRAFVQRLLTDAG